MASFFEELLQSIFTPGPTPVLVVATNAIFAVTLPLLVYLAIFNSNIHFAFLSIICGGLWVSINWFVKEVRAEQAKQEREAAEAEAAEKAKASDDRNTVLEPGTAQPLPTAEEAADESTATVAGASSPVEPVEKHGELKARVVPSSARSGVSTEDEWEKVSEEDEQQKDL